MSETAVAATDESEILEQQQVTRGKPSSKRGGGIQEQKHAATTVAITNEETDTLEQRAATTATRKEETIDGKDQEFLTLTGRRRRSNSVSGTVKDPKGMKIQATLEDFEGLRKGRKRQDKKRRVLITHMRNKWENIEATRKSIANVFATLRKLWSPLLRWSRRLTGWWCCLRSGTLEGRPIGWTCCRGVQELDGTGETDGTNELTGIEDDGIETDPLDAVLGELLVVGNVGDDGDACWMEWSFRNAKDFKPRPSLGVSGLHARVCGESVY